MAISPIQMFQSNQSSLAQLLQGGTQTISGIMDQAIQVGRDISNKQLAQERDMLGMRQQETAMAQRRAENLQQNNEDAQRFARNAFESDRRYGADQAQLGVQNARQVTQDTRQATQDLFQQSNSDRNFSLAEGGLQLRKDEMAAAQSGREAKYQASESAEQTRRREIASLLPNKPEELQGPTQSGNQLFAPVISLTQEQAAGNTAAIKKALANKDTTTEESVALGTRAAELAKLYPDQNRDAPTQASINANISFQQRQEDRVDKAMEEEVLGNPTAFIPQKAVNQKRAADAEKYKDPSKEPTGEEIVGAEAYDKNPYASEKASARKMTLLEYISKGPQDEASKKSREKLWNFVNTGGTAASAAPQAMTAEEAAQSELDAYLK